MTGASGRRRAEVGLSVSQGTEDEEAVWGGGGVGYGRDCVWFPKSYYYPECWGLRHVPPPPGTSLFFTPNRFSVFFLKNR